MNMNKNDNVIGVLTSLLVITVVAAAAINQQSRDAAYKAGQEAAARKVIFAYPGTERSTALDFLLTTEQVRAAAKALRP